MKDRMNGKVNVKGGPFADFALHRDGASDGRFRNGIINEVVEGIIQASFVSLEFR
jgi:hypothetical protein